VDKTVEELLKVKFQRYEKIRQEFHKFFNQDELSYVVENKADIKMIDKVMDIKASKDELANTEAMLENLNDRVKHISNLFSTFTTSMLPYKNTIGKFDD